MKPFLQTLCILWGVACSLSRIADNRHHWWDVMTGATIGAIFAYYYVVVVTMKFKAKNEVTTSSTKTLIDDQGGQVTTTRIV